MKTLFISFASIAIISACFIVNLKMENIHLRTEMDKIYNTVDSISKNMPITKKQRRNKYSESVGYNYWKDKLSVFIDGEWYDVVQHPIRVFKFQGNPYEIETGLSLSPNDSSRVMHLIKGEDMGHDKIIVHPNDPRYFWGL